MTAAGYSLWPRSQSRWLSLLPQTEDPARPPISSRQHRQKVPGSQMNQGAGDIRRYMAQSQVWGHFEIAEVTPCSSRRLTDLPLLRGRRNQMETLVNASWSSRLSAGEDISLLLSSCSKHMMYCTYFNNGFYFVFTAIRTWLNPVYILYRDYVCDKNYHNTLAACTTFKIWRQPTFYDLLAISTDNVVY